MSFLKKNFFIFFLLSYFFVGSTNSVNTGISFDENHEQLNWNFHVSLIDQISNVIINDQKFDREKFDNEVKSFVGYGIGFQLISQPIQFLIKQILILDKSLDPFGAKLLAKHFVVFLFFFISGIFFYLILKKLIENENFTKLSTVIYLTYPYLFGQSMFSPKDIPFMSVWLVCSYYSFVLFEKYNDKKMINTKILISLSVLTAYLLSIRIAGLLIFIQYCTTFFLFLNVNKVKFKLFLRENYLKFFTFLIVLILFIFIFYPIFWINPHLLLETIRINAEHFNNVGTTTLGKIMYAKDLPVTYLFIWFAVKIPLLILIGIFLLPFTEKKIFSEKKRSIIFGSILLSLFFIILILVLKEVHLYDEIRQVMFLMPLFFIIGLVSFFTFSKRIFNFFGIFTVLFFIVENILINPYQYVWFNLPSRYLDLTKNFEMEYQGISGKEISKYLEKYKSQSTCILVNPIWSVKPFLNNTNFKCFDIWQKIDTDYKRPFLAVQNVRNLKKSQPYKCKTIHETSFKLLFHKERIVTGKALKCEK